MNNKLIVIACLLVSLSIGQVPQFGPEIVIQDGNSPMQPVKYPSPTMVDWDGDGKKDMIVGVMDSKVGGLAARVQTYLNTGENNDPKFDGFDWVRTASGSILDGTSW